MNLDEMIFARRTIRRFRPEPISPEALDRLVDAARLAPSAANRQPCEFVVVDDPARVAEVFPLVKWAGYIAPAGNPRKGERPAAYVVILINRRKTPDHGHHDAAAAAMNIIYAALAQGIGSCWMGAIDRAALRELLKVPDNCDVDSLVALGYPAESPVVEPMKGRSVKYWKDASGTLHVPKRPLASTLHRNRY
jgi:nitroreductase